MATPGSTTQPQQVSQAWIPLAAAAHGDEAWDVPGKDGTAAVTQAPNSSIPSKSFSIHKNSANPIHSEIPFRPSHLHSTLSNTAGQHPSMETEQSMSDLPMASPHPNSILGNPGITSLFLPQQYPDQSNASAIWGDLDFQNDFDTNSFSLPDLDLPEVIESGLDATSNPFSQTNPPEGITSSYLAADAVAGGEIGRVMSGSLGGYLTTPAGALCVDAVGDEFPPGHGSDVHMEGDHNVRFCADISIATNGAVLEAGSMEAASTTDQLNLLPVGVGHEASSSATGPDCLRLKSAQGFTQPETSTNEIGNPGLSAWRLALCRVTEKEYQEEAALVWDISAASEVMKGIRHTTGYYKEYILPPHEPPTSRQGRYITTFDRRLEGDKPKNGRRNHYHWNETDVKPIHDPSAPRNIIGLRRTLEYMNGNKRTHWRANEYVAVEALGGDALQILEDIAVRTVYEEEDSETAPPPKCSKNCPHCHSSGGSYIWKHMTKVFVKGEAGSEASLLYAICHECDNKVLKCPPKFGTSNLNRHLGNDHGIRPPCKSQQVMTNKKGGAVVGGSAVRV